MSANSRYKHKIYHDNSIQFDWKLLLAKVSNKSENMKFWSNLKIFDNKNRLWAKTTNDTPKIVKNDIKISFKRCNEYLCSSLF